MGAAAEEWAVDLSAPTISSLTTASPSYFRLRSLPFPILPSLTDDAGKQPQPPPVQSALSKEERAMVQRYRSHREKIHNGPLYTVMATKREAADDPFNGVAKYSEKYKKKTRKAPKLDARPYGTPPPPRFHANVPGLLLMFVRSD